MSDPVIKVAAGQPVTVQMSFQGIANHYEAYLYEPLPGDKWRRVQTLESDGSSDDARPDEFTFTAPAAGKSLLFYFQSPMTAAAVPAEVGATATVQQAGKRIDAVSVSGPVTTFVNVVLRLQVVAQ